MVMVLPPKNKISNSSPKMDIKPTFEFIFTSLSPKKTIPLWFSIVISLFPVTLI